MTLYPESTGILGNPPLSSHGGAFVRGHQPVGVRSLPRRPDLSSMRSSVLFSPRDVHINALQGQDPWSPGDADVWRSCGNSATHAWSRPYGPIWIHLGHRSAPHRFCLAQALKSTHTNNQAGCQACEPTMGESGHSPTPQNPEV